MKKLPEIKKAELLVNLYTKWLIDYKGISTEAEQLYIASLLDKEKKKLDILTYLIKH